MEQEILQKIVEVAVLFLLGLAMWFVSAQKERLKKLADLDELRLAGEIARIVVWAAEQANVAGFVQNKKDYALRLMQEWLEKKGVKLDLLAIEALVEAAVKEMNDAQNRK